jgi:hypothetical protein
MAIYERYNARIANTVRLRRDFYNDGILFDPYKIDKIEIWKTRYDPEYEADNPGSLLMDTVYGSRIVLGGITNNAYGTLGLEAGTSSPAIIQLNNFEMAFTSQTSVTVPHNLGDHYPIVTVYDTTGVVIQPNSITSVDGNTIVVTFAIAQSGIIDIVGTQGVGVAPPTATTKKYQTSFNNAVSVTVVHNLNDDYPNVAIYDSDYNWIFPLNIQTIDSNTIIVTFASAQTGTIIVVGGNTGFAISGFGSAAYILGTKTEPFVVQTGVNDVMTIAIDGGSNQTITFPANCLGYQASDIMTLINASLVGGTATVVNGAIQITSDTTGSTSSIALITVAHSIYSTLGMTVGTILGLGYAPAYTEGGKTGAYTITNTTKYVKIALNGGSAHTIDLLEGDTITKRLTGERICAIINAVLVGCATMSSTRTITLTAATSVDIQTVTDNAYTELGFAVAVHGASYSGTAIEYFIFDATNNLMQIINNYQGAVNVTLTTGNQTLAQVIASINAVFTANSINAIAEMTTGTTGGRLRIRSLINDGIIRTGLGQYYTDYSVPTSFVADGVLVKQYLDVWYYSPIIGYENDIADDTDTFIVYADKYFLDSGFGNYDFAFTLMRDLFYVGEKRPLITKVIPLPRYKTPIVNDWILPLSDTQYRIFTDEGSLVQDWADTDLNSGTEIRVALDTTSTLFRDGLYTLQLRVNIPNGEVVLSNRLNFRITAK